jgi:hypothetical protein
MKIVQPSRWRREYELLDDDGAVAGRLRVVGFASRGEAEVDGRRFELRRRGILRRRIVVTRDGRVVLLEGADPRLLALVERYRKVLTDEETAAAVTAATSGP